MTAGQEYGEIANLASQCESKVAASAQQTAAAGQVSGDAVANGDAQNAEAVRGGGGLNNAANKENNTGNTAGFFGSVNQYLFGKAKEDIQECIAGRQKVDTYRAKYGNSVCSGTRAYLKSTLDQEKIFDEAIGHGRQVAGTAALGALALYGISQTKKDSSKALKNAVNDGSQGGDGSTDDAAGAESTGEETASSEELSSGTQDVTNLVGSDLAEVMDGGECSEGNSYKEPQCVGHFVKRCEGYLMATECRDFSNYYCSNPQGSDSAYCRSYSMAKYCSTEVNKPQQYCQDYFKSYGINSNSICDSKYSASSCMEVMDAANNVQAFHGLLNDCGTVTSPRGDANRCELFRDRYPNGVERQLANDGGVNSLVNAHLSVSQNNYTGSAVIGGGGVNTQSLSRPADVNPSNSNNLAVVNSGHIEICHSGFMYNCAN